MIEWIIRSKMLTTVLDVSSRARTFIRVWEFDRQSGSDALVYSRRGIRLVCLTTSNYPTATFEYLRWLSAASWNLQNLEPQLLREVLHLSIELPLARDLTTDPSWRSHVAESVSLARSTLLMRVRMKQNYPSCVYGEVLRRRILSRIDVSDGKNWLCFDHYFFLISEITGFAM